MSLPPPHRPGVRRPLMALGLATLLVALPALTPGSPPAPPPVQPDPTGLWITEEETSVIRIQECDAGLCGDIHWLAPDARQFDTENRDRSLRDRPLCGLEILRDFEQNPDNPAEWRDGEVYAADDGRTYSARIRVQGPDELELRGYRGIALIGRSQTWVRVDQEDYPRCEPPGATTASSRWGAPAR